MNSPNHALHSCILLGVFLVGNSYGLAYLTFHPDKCKIMHLGKPLEEQFKYTLHDGTIRHELGYTSEEKDIGVIIDSNLEFDKHVYFKVNKQIALWP